VVVLERTNVRDLGPGMLPFRPSLVVADLSFVSLRHIVAHLVELAAERADLVLLVKPQFEAARHEVGAGGVVRDPSVWRRCIDEVLDACDAAGAVPSAATPSTVVGPAGNVEFFVHAITGSTDRSDVPDLDAVIEEARRIGGNA
jgi:23S rRNA (cytidine1920-2'-O)/16S rRNA (cytidine1409-2'-O)-methyltransferase